MSEPISVILVTAPAGDAARELARALVRDGRAACVNVVPGVHSVYRWEGEVEEAAEALLIIKAPRRGLAALRERVAALHPYDVPEFVVLDVADGIPAYLEWVAGVVAG
jgi:periplasmic divalent cation tolerance protein